MRRITSLAITAAISAALVIPAAAPASAADLRGTVVQDSLFGMHVFGSQDGAWPTIPFGALRIWDSGTAWSNIEKAPGVYDWTKLDTVVATAEKNGMTNMMMVLAGTPAWASSTPNSKGHPGQLPGEQGMPTDIAFWDRWVEAVVTRYKGRITSYQPWNEANLTTFFTGTPAEMATLTKRAYDIVKRVDPKAQVIAPSTGTRLGGPFKAFYPKYLAELKQRGWPVDVFTAHTYPASLGTPKDRRALANAWIDMLRAAGAPDLPIWDTELNFGLAGPGPANPDQDLTGRKAQDWAARSYLDALRLGISSAYWYAWGPDNDLLGIQMNSAAPAAKALSTLQDWIVGATYVNCNEKPNKAVTCNFTKGGNRFQVVWSEGPKRSFKAPAGATKSCDINGNCKPLKGNRKVKVNSPTLLSR
jgi:GH35 family endo-1,4-beta-xylanase